MWTKIYKNNYPKKEGNYKCLVEIDELGNLEEMENQYFNGKDFCHFKSCRQFIRYWWKDE